MPTGYTSKIHEGICFKEFAMGCARGFGACISMRDDENDKPIPEKFEVDSYHAGEIVKAQKELASALAMDESEAEEQAKKEFNKEKKRLSKKLDEVKELHKKYSSILQQAKSYIPPSKDHERFKEFMIEQLETSMNFDCDIGYYEEQLKSKVKPQTGKQFKKELIEEAKHSIAYNQKELKEEQERIEERNTWISLTVILNLPTVEQQVGWRGFALTGGRTTRND